LSAFAKVNLDLSFTAGFRKGEFVNRYGAIAFHKVIGAPFPLEVLKTWRPDSARWVEIVGAGETGPHKDIGVMTTMNLYMQTSGEVTYFWEPKAGIEQMATAVDEYFRSGGRICLVGAFALDETRDRFADPIRAYFVRWIEALSGALVRAGRSSSTARTLAEDYVVGVQGALVLARATGDVAVFARSTQRLMAAFAMP